MELMSPEPHVEGGPVPFRPFRQGDVRERLLHPELGVINDRPRTDISSRFDIARVLRKEPDATAYMKVAIGREPL
jgi:hypothetical protein